MNDIILDKYRIGKGSWFFNGFDAASLVYGHVHNYTARLHLFYHIFRNKFRCFCTRYENGTYY